MWKYRQHLISHSVNEKSATASSATSSVDTTKKAVAVVEDHSYGTRMSKKKVAQKQETPEMRIDHLYSAVRKEAETEEAVEPAPERRRLRRQVLVPRNGENVSVVSLDQTETAVSPPQQQQPPPNTAAEETALSQMHPYSVSAPPSPRMHQVWCKFLYA